MFENLLESYNTYFRMDQRICEKTMAPIFQFTSIITGQVIEYKLARTDIQEYNKGIISGTIKDMISDLSIHIRDIKIDKIIE